jgi:long-chain acyl-CoA synthetase
VGQLADGTLFAPKYIENKLKFFPQVKVAVAFGADMDFVTAFINIDLEAVGNWAEKHNLAYAGYTDLAGRAEVAVLIKECIEKVNQDLATDSRLSNSQIRRFLVLPKELDADDGELTRTLKVRRSAVAERYAPLVEALFEGRKSVDMDMEVKFDDGRVGRLRASIVVHDAATSGTVEMRKAS